MLTIESDRQQPKHDYVSRELRGIFSRENWRSKDKDRLFIIARLQDNTIIKGNMPIEDCICGMEYRFVGQWKEDRKYGWGFHFENYVRPVPHTRYGLATYLSANCSGVGQRISNLIYDIYGQKAVIELRNNPAEVAAKVNATAKRQIFAEEAAIAASETLKSVNTTEETRIELLGLLGGRGFPREFFEQVIEKFGALAATRIKRDPFTLLVHRFTGAGFRRVDTLYCDLGHNPAAVKRQLFCLLDAIERDSTGHTWFSAQALSSKLAGSIGKTSPRFERTVKVGLRAKRLAACQDTRGVIWITTHERASAEQECQRRLLSLLGSSEPVKPTTLDVAGGAGLGPALAVKQRTSIFSLGASCEEIEVVRPMPVTVTEDDGRGYIASVNGTSIASGGETFDEAISCLQEMVASSFKRLRELSHDQLGPKMQDELALLRNFLRETEPAQAGSNTPPATSSAVPPDPPHPVVMSPKEIQHKIRLGKQTGWCQFCSRRLDNPISMHHGYGPTCAKKYGLPWSSSELYQNLEFA